MALNRNNRQKARSAFFGNNSGLETSKYSLELSLASPTSPTTIGLTPPQFENRVNMRRICHILAGLLVCAGLLRTVSGFIFDYLHPEYVSSFPSYLYFLRAVPFLIAAGAVETILFLIKRRNK